MTEFSLHPDPKDQIQIGETVLCLPIGIYAKVKNVLVAGGRFNLEALYVLEGVQSDFHWKASHLKRLPEWNRPADPTR